jgi:hypothetical protein
MAVTWDKVPQLAPNLKAFGNSFNRRFPGRDGASDGAWGNEEHKPFPSGHNPDDTKGSRPESEDADTKPELRAIDVDADLNEPGVTMQDVADAIIADSDVRARMSYVIFNRRIAGDGTKWAWRPYSGDNDHTKHLHGSGKPGADENGAPFGVIENFGKDGGGELTQRASDLIEAMSRKSGTKGLPAVPEKDSPINKIEQLWDRFGKLESAVTDIKSAVTALRDARTPTSASGEAFQANTVTPLSIERNLGAASDKELQAELDRRRTAS